MSTVDMVVNHLMLGSHPRQLSSLIAVRCTFLVAHTVPPQAPPLPSPAWHPAPLVAPHHHVSASSQE